MSTVQEIKAAATKLTTEEKAELAHWLTESDAAVRRRSREEWYQDWVALAEKAKAEIGPITWKREDLYER